jgi:hypothetical protein
MKYENKNDKIINLPYPSLTKRGASLWKREVRRDFMTYGFT